MSGPGEDFEEAWAQIVADLSADLPVEGTEAALQSDLPGDPPTDPGAAPPPPPTIWSAKPPAARWLPEPAAPADDGAGDPGAFVDNWQDEGHYQPPPPPELPAGTPAKRLAWAGVIGGPLALLLSALTPWNPPPVVALGAGLATLAGFVTLVWLLPQSRDDGWDDGARV